MLLFPGNAGDGNVNRAVDDLGCRLWLVIMSASTVFWEGL